MLERDKDRGVRRVEDALGSKTCERRSFGRGRGLGRKDGDGWIRELGGSEDLLGLKTGWDRRLLGIKDPLGSKTCWDQRLVGIEDLGSKTRWDGIPPVTTRSYRTLYMMNSSSAIVAFETSMVSTPF